jgi:class 3 adenylate cyclase
LFTGIEGSIRLWEAGPAGMAEASARHNRIVREQIELAGGRVYQTAGEEFCAAFADPSAALAAGGGGSAGRRCAGVVGGL